MGLKRALISNACLPERHNLLSQVLQPSFITSIYICQARNKKSWRVSPANFLLLFLNFQALLDANFKTSAWNRFAAISLSNHRHIDPVEWGDCDGDGYNIAVVHAIIRLIREAVRTIPVSSWGIGE